MVRFKGLRTGKGGGSRRAYLELIFRDDTPVLEVLLQTLDGVLGRAHALDLLTRTVSRSRVRHPN